MKIKEIVKLNSIKQEINQLEEYFNIIKDYSFLEIDEEKLKEIEKSCSKLGIYLIRSNSEIKNLIKNIGLEKLIE